MEEEIDINTICNKVYKVFYQIPQITELSFTIQNTPRGTELREDEYGGLNAVSDGGISYANTITFYFSLGGFREFITDPPDLNNAHVIKITVTRGELQ